jgi:hypothetical protein
MMTGDMDDRTERGWLFQVTLKISEIQFVLMDYAGEHWQYPQV